MDFERNFRIIFRITFFLYVLIGIFVKKTDPNIILKNKFSRFYKKKIWGGKLCKELIWICNFFKNNYFKVQVFPKLSFAKTKIWKETWINVKCRVLKITDRVLRLVKKIPILRPPRSQVFPLFYVIFTFNPFLLIGHTFGRLPTYLMYFDQHFYPQKNL